MTVAPAADLATAFTRQVGIEVPLVCGAMYPCSNPELVAAVSAAGGLGVVQPISLTWVYGHDFREGLRLIRRRTDRPIGMNALIEASSKTYRRRMEGWVDVALEEGVRFFVTSLGNPRWVVERVHAAGGVAYHDVTERRWAEKGLAAGVDGLIAVNRRAGGHPGPRGAAELFAELADLGVPLICAGGVGAPEDFVAALEMGYAGVQAGTRFIATDECRAARSLQARHRGRRRGRRGLDRAHHRRAGGGPADALHRAPGHPGRSAGPLDAARPAPQAPDADDLRAALPVAAQARLARLPRLAGLLAGRPQRGRDPRRRARRRGRPALRRRPRRPPRVRLIPGRRGPASPAPRCGTGILGGRGGSVAAIEDTEQTERTAPPFRRIAIVNRGEAAMRFIHAAREYSLEHGAGLVTIALYTDPDQRALFVREADEAHSLGPAFAVDPDSGERKSAYLLYDHLARALTTVGAEAVWVGWGFVAEHPEFADLCAELGIVFLGPSGEVMRRLGDKIGAKRLAEQSEVPVAPWSGGPVETLDEARRWSETLGFPLMIKATAGGGGRGIRRVGGAEELEAAFTAARSEGRKAFGDPTVFLERLVQGARHVEVQVIADAAGTAWALGVRDCTIQRRHQKLLEETPSPALTPDEDRFLRQAASRLTASAGYVGAGTVEFLFEPGPRRFSFLEVNARLQVEHPVTELVTGTDLVKLQIHVGRGGLLEGEPPPARGHAIEVRLNAEDPDRDFAPSPGRVEVFRPARGPGLRIDSGVEEGDVIPSEFDSMIAKVIGYGASREEAMARLRRGLAQTAVVIRGGASNKAFLQELLDRDEVRSGAYDVGWLDRLAAYGERLPARGAALALVQAAIEIYEDELEAERTRFWSAAARGRPEVSSEVGRKVDLHYRGRSYTVLVDRSGAETYRLRVGRVAVEATVERLGRTERRLTCGGRSHRIFAVGQGVDHVIEVDGIPHRISGGEEGVVRSPAPAVVVSLAVAEGDEVATGDRLAVIEAMKMETAVVAEFAGRVRQVLVRPNVQVAAGAPLLVIEPAAEEESVTGEAISFAALEAPADPAAPRPRCLAALETLRRWMLGWDLGEGEPARRTTQHGVLCRDLPQPDGEMEALENAVLGAFVDVCALFRRRPDEETGDTGRRTTEEYLFTYLRDTGGRGRGLPAVFLDKLRRALRHYGLDDLRPRPELREALFRLCKSNQRMADQVAPVLSILERRLEAGERPPDGPEDGFRELLHRLVEETRDRFPAVHDLAREVHYRFLDEPFLAAVRDRLYAEAEAELDRVETASDDATRARGVEALVSGPQPLQGLFGARFAAASGERQRWMLEVLLRRFYRVAAPLEIETRRHRGHPFAAARFQAGDTPVYVVAGEAMWDDFRRLARLAVRRLRKAGRGEEAVIDLILHRDAGFEDEDSAEAAVAEVLAEVELPERLSRCTVSLSTPAASGPRVHYFTYRLGAEGWSEDRLLRGFHPLHSQRLQIWRLGRFDIERLPSAEGIFAFHGRARDNPSDERLFVISEVRDMTPLVERPGDAPRFPQLERVFMEALAVIRRFQSRRPPEQRLQWNRVTLYVQPPLALPPARLRALVRRLAPATQGLGLQKVVVLGRMRDPSGELTPGVLELTHPAGRGVVLRFRRPADEPIESLSGYQTSVVRLRRRGLVPPYELIRLLASAREDGETDLPPGEFVEHDLDADGDAVPVDRPPGENTANLVFGVVRNFTPVYPEGMTRVVMVSDPGRGMGALSEPECRRILAALDLARRTGVPVEWFATSAGAKISMQSGTENMDWIARVLRRLVEATQDGLEVNLVITGVNVGAQPYWNAEATMLMHTRGVLIMTPDAAMVLTGKQALDYSGGVSAEDNQGIGGYERIMGPNGQAQYFADDLTEACRILLAYYERTYSAPGERFPRRRGTADPLDRDVSASPHGGAFERIGEIFSDDTNPGRKKPFDIRRVMAAVIDADRPPLERWYGMADAEIAVVWDAFLGGLPVSLLGFESQPLPRLGFHPADGPDQWTSGTLFPQSSKKIARALNAASGNRPVVVLANLSGFDGSPESMRKWQLEYGAEIGRAVVNFRGPMVFCVVSRYHGGAFVVFSNALNDNFRVAALEGAHASVIGGAPAAAVVFAREVDQRAKADPRVAALEAEIAAADPPQAAKLRTRLPQLLEEVRSEKLGEVAGEFDRVHSVHRALEVGSVHEILPARNLRPWLIAAVEAGMARELERLGREGAGPAGAPDGPAPR